MVTQLLGQVATAEEDRESLRGLTGVYVLVEHLTKEAERDGLSENQLQTDVELRLRRAGIKVQTRQESLASPGRPYLYVRVTERKKSDLPLYALCVQVEFVQAVQLER